MNKNRTENFQMHEILFLLISPDIWRGYFVTALILFIQQYNTDFALIVLLHSN